MPSLCIATWNLDYLSLRSDRARICHAKMEEVRAQVWVLTETQRGFYPGIGFHLVAESEKASDLNDDQRWVAIWANQSVSVTYEKTKGDERTACVQLEIDGGRTLIVYGTVLPWVGSTWNEQPSKGGQAFIQALEQQKTDWIGLQEANPQALLCVAGDYNQDLLKSGRYYGSAIQRKALRKALEEAKLRCYTGGENDPVSRRSPGDANIDHICFGGSQIIDVTADAWSPKQQGMKISDHFGVSVQISYA